MNYKTILMASAAMLFASQAVAEDLTGAFSVPGEGQFTSDTSIKMSREKTGWRGDRYFAADSLAAQETIEYGITDKFSVNASIINNFDKEGLYNNDHNFEYHVGAKYNTRCDNNLFQVAATYKTADPKDYYGKHTPERWAKAVDLDLKAGIDMGNGLTPYIVYSVESEIDTSSRSLSQSVSAGIHKYTGEWALDGAVRYSWDKNNKDPKNGTEIWFDAEADYYVKDNAAIGIYGSYLINAHDMKDAAGNVLRVKDGHEIGIRFKVLF